MFDNLWLHYHFHISLSFFSNFGLFFTHLFAFWLLHFKKMIFKVIGCGILAFTKWSQRLSFTCTRLTTTIMGCLFRSTSLLRILLFVRLCCFHLFICRTTWHRCLRSYSSLFLGFRTSCMGSYLAFRLWLGNHVFWN